MCRTDGSEVGSPAQRRQRERVPTQKLRRKHRLQVDEINKSRKPELQAQFCMLLKYEGSPSPKLYKHVWNMVSFSVLCPIVFKKTTAIK